MQGRILDFSISEGRGVITGDDGKRYTFLSQEWKEQQPPSKGQVVDFDIGADNAAIDIYLALPTANASLNNLSENIKNISKNLDSKNQSNYSAFDWFLIALKKYATFSGRAQRKEFWFYVLFNFLIVFVLSLIDGLLFGTEVLSSLFSLATLLPTLAVSARRLHDINKSGWWQLLAFIPLVGIIILIVWYAKAGDTDNNLYGPNPLIS